jgi:hypothetical protein
MIGFYQGGRKPVLITIQLLSPAPFSIGSFFALLLHHNELKEKTYAEINSPFYNQLDCCDSGIRRPAALGAKE